ncbi:MAG: glycosyltransferase [Planctomycetaceae bacterium]|nr:glycosyltransferase [Planctomycetaceae bacterium]
MKVLYLTDSLSDLDGVGRYAMGLIRALEDEVDDLSVEVLLARKHRPTSASVPARWRAKVGLPPDYFFYMSAPRFWVSFAAGLWHTWRAARRADLVHAIKDYPHNFLGLVAARLAGRPCIATAHGTYTVQPLLDRRHARLARWTYARLAALIAVSGFTARRLLEELGPEGRDLTVRTIPNCVEVGPLDEPVDVGPRPWHGLRYTLGIGETKERKGHHLALAAWVEVAKNHPDLHHMLVGRLSGDAYEQRLRGIAAAAGLADRVHFLGNVSEAEKVDLLRGAELFVHTPVTAADGGFEGFGIVYLEASACRKPVIGTLGCGAEDAIADGRTGYLVEPKVDAVAAALARLVGDGELRRRMGEEGRAHALENTWAKNAREVLRLYREVQR